jgi:hypothetical protein
MGRDIGSHSFREELDSHADRLTELEKSGGGGGDQLPLFLEDIFGQVSGSPANLLIGNNLTLSTPEEGWMKIDANDQLTLVQEGTNEWSGIDKLVFGFGLDVEDNSGEGEIIVRQSPLLQVDAVSGVSQINLGPGLTMEDNGDGVITIALA